MIAIATAIPIVTVAPMVYKWDSNRGLMREAAVRFGCSIGRTVNLVSGVTGFPFLTSYSKSKYIITKLLGSESHF